MISPMDIQLAAERLFVLEERVTVDEIRQRAMDKRTQAFGAGIGSLLQRARPEEVVLLNQQRRLEPFWHVSCSARYVYDRKREYTIGASAPDVAAVTIAGDDYQLDAQQGHVRAFRLAVMEHCREELHKEVYVDGLNGQPVVEAPVLLSAPRSEVADPASLSSDNTIALAPEHRASYVVRQLLSEMMKPVQADQVHEEAINLEVTDLYYRPIWSFEFSWTTRDNRRGAIEVDSITGQVRQGRTQQAGGQLGVKLTREVLFDIGADTASLFIPGGSIAVRLAQVAMDSRKASDKPK